MEAACFKQGQLGGQTMVWMIEQTDETILNSKKEMLELNISCLFYLRCKKWAMAKRLYSLSLDFISEYMSK